MPETAPRTSILSAADLPSDGMITVRSWNKDRRRGWHIEQITADHDDMVWVLATPVNISTNRTNGETQLLLLAFGLDTIEVMP
jgi:hypothetical protein